MFLDVVGDGVFIRVIGVVGEGIFIGVSDVVGEAVEVLDIMGEALRVGVTAASANIGAIT